MWCCMLGVRQSQILRLICVDHLTQIEICQRLKMKPPRVCLIIKQLKEKGLISYGRNPHKIVGGGGHPRPLTCNLNRTTLLENAHLIRLHGQVFELKILNGSRIYDSTMKLNQVLDFESHKIQLMRDKLIVHGWPGLEFIGKSGQEAHERSRPYWLALFQRLEKRLNVLIFKAGHTQIREVKTGHYAEMNNGLAADLKRRREALHFKGGDGVEWLLSDMSKGVPELEAVHPVFSQRDIDTLKPMFDDIRTKNPGITFTAFSSAVHDRIMRGETRIKEIEDYIMKTTGLSNSENNVFKTQKLKDKDTYFG